ncbi:MAG TPA: TetR/AcrR family transcriptional regulator [Bradyrhizobium sp.]|uniref:TetR/AcrR family transcriptional regulator n=1 Tax=Bradyrhizobium sp. TaxID=376 RepID=UPI002CB7960E|nr:TetR/AcrR family transcriptional regulator [Bradyrhizobium sp.]HLZ06031.1 TetR/AcrR family transcriptional regulator [Bradyrhizobium sp.]
MKQLQKEAEETPVRRRILEAAFSAFRESGYAGTSTLEIATRARVSKRELYALVGNKDELLAACIGARARRLQMPADLPVPRDRKTLGATLTSFGVRLLREISDPAVIGVFRLAIAEAVRAPEVARALDSIGRGTSRTALRGLMDQARSAGLLDGEVGEMAEQFYGLLWGSLLVSLLLGVADRPSAREITRRAHDATVAFLRLYLKPHDAAQ